MVGRGRFALAVWIAGPVVAVTILLFGGSLPSNCLALDCPPPEPGLPIIGTTTGLQWTLAGTILAWLLAGAWLLRRLARRGHPLLLEAVRTTLVGGFLGGGLGFAYGLLEGHRLRAGAELAVIVAIIGVILAWEIRLAWLALRAGPDPRRAA